MYVSWHLRKNVVGVRVDKFITYFPEGLQRCWLGSRPSATGFFYGCISTGFKA